MEHTINWIVELNRSNHTGFAFLTVFVMVSFGIAIASVIELFFFAIGIKQEKTKDRPELKKTAGLQSKNVKGDPGDGDIPANRRD